MVTGSQCESKSHSRYPFFIPTTDSLLRASILVAGTHKVHLSFTPDGWMLSARMPTEIIGSLIGKLLEASPPMTSSFSLTTKLDPTFGHVTYWAFLYGDSSTMK